MRLVSTMALVLAAGCGSVSYGTSEVYYEEVEVSPGRYVTVSQPASQPDRVAVIQAPQPLPPPPVMMAPPPPVVMAPPPPVVMAPPPAEPVGNAPIHCSGNERVRVHDQIVDGGGGPAVIASGNCVVDVSESIVRGAIHASGNASLRFAECRLEGDIHASGNARIDTPGSRLRRVRF